MLNILYIKTYTCMREGKKTLALETNQGIGMFKAGGQQSLPPTSWGCSWGGKKYHSYGIVTPISWDITFITMATHLQPQLHHPSKWASSNQLYNPVG